jgi:hypothetical protein
MPCVRAAAEPRADDATRAAARDLTESGIEAYWAADYSSADGKLEQAFRLFAVPTVGLWSARAREKLGKWVEAAERYREAARASALVGDRSVQRTAQEEARQELRELVERMPSVTFQIEGPETSNVALTLDDVAVPSAMIGVRRPTSPGTHRIAATRGNKHYARRFELAEREQKTVPIRFDPPAPVKVIDNQLVVESREPTPELMPQPLPGSTTQSLVSAASAQASSPPLGPVFTWIGVGLTLGVGALTVFSGIDSINHVPEYRLATEVLDECKRTLASDCQAQETRATDALEKGQWRETRTNILLAGTAVAAAGTLVVALFLTDWSNEQQPQGVARIHIDPRADGASFVLSGTF